MRNVQNHIKGHYIVSFPFFIIYFKSKYYEYFYVSVAKIPITNKNMRVLTNVN